MNREIKKKLKDILMFKKINIAKRSKEKFYHLIILHKGVIINDILGRNRILQGKAEIGNNSV